MRQWTDSEQMVVGSDLEPSDCVFLEVQPGAETEIWSFQENSFL